MITNSFKIDMPYEYHPEHSGAPYMIGNAFKNHGEFIESAIKYHMGLDYLINPATSYDTGSDIECLSASVKSSGASLARVYGDTYDEIKTEYFEKVHSTMWIYGTEIDGELICFYMNRNEFESFLDNFATLAVESGNHKIKIRLRSESKKMLSWLMAQC